MQPPSAPAAREVADFLDAHIELACLPADRARWQEVINFLRAAIKPRLNQEP